MGEREAVGLTTLAMDRQIPGAPIDVIERQRGDLARAQPRRESSMTIQ